MQKLPIDDILPDLLRTVKDQKNSILHAPPGAGKTTRVPLALLDIIPSEAGRIIMLEPRRLAAVSAARWMAGLLGEEAGETVGYSIRFESRVSTATRIEVVTEGILTRRLQNNPLLEGVAVVIFDEFHERSIQADLGLALCLDVQRQVRDDLRILVMSATLDCGPLSRLMGDAPIISSPGRSFPVDEIYLDDRGHAALPERMASAILKALAETQGDMLAFLPGAGEIRSCAKCLAASWIADKGIEIYQLYGDLPFSEQQKAIQPGMHRKVVLATAIAETSLTIEGVRVVIDCGLSRRLRFDNASAMNRLVTLRESKASAEQRKGRAGRVAPGRCYRLFGRHTFHAMTEHSPPEILDMDLSSLLLELSAWGVSEPDTLDWLDEPSAASLETARRLLLELGAIDRNARINSLGMEMADLPLHPRLSRLLLRSVELGCPDTGCDLAALLSERDIIRLNPFRVASSGFNTDIFHRLEILRSWRPGGRVEADADIPALKSVERVSSQLRRILKATAKTASVRPDSHIVMALLLSAYPDRVGQRRDAGSGRYLLSNGRGARFRAAESVEFSPYVIALNVGGGELSEGVMHLCAELDEEVLREHLADRIECCEGIDWDDREGRVTAFREERIGALCLLRKAVTPPAEKAIAVVLQAVRASALNLLTRDDSFMQLQARVNLLRRHFPDDGWPDMSDQFLTDSLDEWLGPWLDGITTARQLAALNACETLSGSMEYRLRRLLNDLAPTHIQVPSGSRIRLDYCCGETPVLAVKLQEMFGLAETPAVAGGRVAVLLHLLSPAGRPLQVTSDLKGFWDGSYHQIKKEMKGRYPKHPWPDDPWNALPTRRTKQK